MAALFEQTIFIFEDIVIQLDEETQHHRRADGKRHTNLDGYMDF